MQPPPRKRIVLIVGPGTLPSQGRDRMDLTHYNVRFSHKGRLSGAEILAALPELQDFADVAVDPAAPPPVATHADLCGLAVHVQAVVDGADVDGVVFAQGTNTLEETAFFLNLTLATRKPVVVVAAQRPFTAISTDAHLNLVNAVRVAACDAAASLGVLAVANSEINAARDVTKTSTFQVQTFRSRGVGLLGYADADRIVFYRAPTRRHTWNSEFHAIPATGRLPCVDILYAHTGARAGLARAAVALGAEGLVVAGIGAGALGLFADELKVLAREGVCVVRSARVGEGRVIPTGNAHEEGMIAADNLNPQKAALLLALALTRTRDVSRMQTMFDTY